MNKKIISLITITLLFLVKTSLFCMEIDADVAGQGVIYVISTQEDATGLYRPEGAFYETLVAQTLYANRKTPRIVLKSFVCPSGFTSMLDPEKVLQAQRLATQILLDKQFGAKHIFIFAADVGVDIAAISSQLLNKSITTTADTTKAHCSEQQVFAEAMNTSRAQIFDSSNYLDRTFMTEQGSFDLDQIGKIITIHIIHPEPNSPYTEFFKADSTIVETVQHIDPKEGSCLTRCLRCVQDPRTEKIAKICIKIVIAAIIAAA